MEESPFVFSLGRLCMTCAYSFRWGTGESPKLILPNGGSSELEVDHYVPFVAAALDVHGMVEYGPKRRSGAFPRAASGAERPTAQELHPHHFMTHFLKDSRCAECMKAKAQNRPRRRQRNDKFGPVLEDEVTADRFGDLLTVDHSVIADEASASRGGSMYGLVTREKATVWIECFPKGKKNTTVRIASFQQCVSPKEQERRLFS